MNAQLDKYEVNTDGTLAEQYEDVDPQEAFEFIGSAKIMDTIIKDLYGRMF